MSTGTELEIVNEMPASGVPAIVIGDCAASRAAGIEAGAIPVEGFVVKTAPNRVFLVGSTIKLPEVVDFNGPYGNEGTAWALADFLERFLAVRWYWPVNAGGRSVVPGPAPGGPPGALQRPAGVPEDAMLPRVRLRRAPRRRTTPQERHSGGRRQARHGRDVGGPA